MKQREHPMYLHVCIQLNSCGVTNVMRQIHLYLQVTSAHIYMYMYMMKCWYWGCVQALSTLVTSSALDILRVVRDLEVYPAVAMLLCHDLPWNNHSYNYVYWEHNLQCIKAEEYLQV